jgi:hypothetical protein
MTTAIAAMHVDVASPGRRPPSEFKIFPMGVVKSLKGEFLFDAAAARMVMAAAQEHGVDFTVDYDHHTLHTSKGVQAISAGWFGLDLRADGLYAVNVRWTDKAAQHLRKGEYRYFSPLFNFDDSSGRITSLINNALTNTPAIDGLEALVAASATHHHPFNLSLPGDLTMPTTAPSDDQVARAYRAATSPGSDPRGRIAALSALGGPVQLRATLDQGSDFQFVRAMSAEEIEMTANATRTRDPVALGRFARDRARRALSRSEADAAANVVEQARARAFTQGGR